MIKKKKLILQIFPSFLLITVISLAVVAWYATSFYEKDALENAEKDLTVRTILTRRELFKTLEQEKEDIFSEKVDLICKEVGRMIDTRMTVIHPSGKVTGDSFADIETLDNHRGRPEIKKAFTGEKGVSVRYSSTLEEKLMYVALPVVSENRNIAVIRASISISSIEREIRSIRRNILLVLVLTVAAAAGASLYVSSRITRPIEEMKTGARRFAKGELEKRLAVPGSEELSELALTMNHMAESLAEKIQALRNRTTELEAVHSSMKEGVIAVDQNERIITVNRASGKILDFPPHMLKGKHILEAARNYELQNFIKSALATRHPVERDIRIDRAEKYIINIHSTALHDNAGNRIGTLIIFHDITRIKKLENMQKAFAANVSHELKTPLTSIKGFIETLQSFDGRSDPEEYRNFLKIIEKNVNRMIALVNDLLSLSRLERMQGGKISLETVNLKRVIKEAINTCRISNPDRDISIKALLPEHIEAPADPLLLEQAVVNLVDNAVKYSPDGTRINVAAFKDGETAVISVTDHGPGISREHLDKIFNRFYRVDRDRSRQTGGTGLGLAIVKHIAQYHAGKIEVESTPGKGSTFSIYLPLKHPDREFI
ncbi:MAG: ATP-binding protein [Thermodesulfobacteriota bacterium]